MKGKPEVLQVLQEALTDELGAVHGYILHAEMCENWGYAALAGATTKRAIEEMKHAEKLISRILFLDGAPDVQSLPKIKIGKDVEEQLSIGLKDESGAVVSYNQGSAICTKAGDNASAELLKGNLADEDL
jgi:bacterioferritin